mmetsp:Transcript_19904/g.41716  ORF Transcript_19904/g.41716 Transcript_19904/m.41716 type:complete len:226 (+) Transcript_19904:819-1496(+)
MVMIWPYSIGGRLMPANTPLGLFESSAAQSKRSDEPQATAPSTLETMKRNRIFHRSGIGDGRTLSYPIEMSAPSLSRVISMSMRTGSWKKKGQPSHFSYSGHFSSEPSRHLVLLVQMGRTILQPGLKSITPSLAGAALLGSLGLKALRWKNVTWRDLRTGSAALEMPDLFCTDVSTEISVMVRVSRNAAKRSSSSPFHPLVQTQSLRGRLNTWSCSTMLMLGSPL